MVFRLRKILAGSLALILPLATVAAQSNAAMVYATGTVSINGRAITSATSAYAGDRIQTAANSSAIVSVEQETIQLPANSALTYSDKVLQVTQGGARVTSSRGMSVQFRNLTITSPAGKKAEVVVGEADGKYTVAALENPVTVSDGVNSMVLAPGKSLTQATANSPLPSPEAPSAGNAFVRDIPGWTVGLILAGAIAGIMGGLAAAGTFDKEDASPVRP